MSRHKKSKGRKPRKKRRIHKSIAIPRYRKEAASYYPKELVGYEGLDYYNPPWIYPKYVPSASGQWIRNMKECWDFNHGAPPYQRGDPFLLKWRYTDFPLTSSVNLKVGHYMYQGCFRIEVPKDPMSGVYGSYVSTASSYGAQAWKAARPVKPRASLAQALGELRDFPSLWKLQIKKFQDLGNSYLNYQFGWKPFIKDIQKFFELQVNLEQRIAFVRKNNNKWLVRKGTIRDTHTTTVREVDSWLRPTLATNFYPGMKASKTVEYTEDYDKIWYKGRMKYYIQELSVDKALDVWTSPLLRKLYGFELTPALAWELLPWSWFQDWFVNIGDIIENFSNSLYDNLVAKYFFVMRQRCKKFNYFHTQKFNNDQGPVTVQATASCVAECKERDGAAQWGFGGGEDTYSTYQLLVLAALGIQTVKIK